MAMTAPSTSAAAIQRHADEVDVRVSVGDAVEDGVVLEEQLEAADVLAQREGEQQESGGDGDAAPGQANRGCLSSRSSARAPPAASRNSAAMIADQHRQREQPSGDELPRRQREEIEVQRLAKDGIGGAGSRGRRVPVRAPAWATATAWPRRWRARSAAQSASGDQREHAADGQIDGPAAEEDGVACRAGRAACARRSSEERAEEDAET